VGDGSAPRYEFPIAKQDARNATQGFRIGNILPHAGPRGVQRGGGSRLHFRRRPGAGGNEGGGEPAHHPPGATARRGAAHPHGALGGGERGRSGLPDRRGAGARRAGVRPRQRARPRRRASRHAAHHRPARRGHLGARSDPWGAPRPPPPPHGGRAAHRRRPLLRRRRDRRRAAPLERPPRLLTRGPPPLHPRRLPRGLARLPGAPRHPGHAGRAPRSPSPPAPAHRAGGARARRPAGAGIAITLRHAARTELAAGRLVEVLPDHVVESPASLWFVHLPGPLPPKVRALRNLLESRGAGSCGAPLSPPG
jgi:hypothetical protein